MTQFLSEPAHHLDCLSMPFPRELCGICGVGVHDFLCDRCGAAMHWACYWLAVASEAERQGVADAVAEVNARPIAGIVIICGAGDHEVEIPVIDPCSAGDYLAHLGSFCRACRS
jgi:hypothetical protein